ncbi:MAG TPA: transporter substrate-binding domain-containing protein, partial [Bryobacteraceae bacterium]
MPFLQVAMSINWDLVSQILVSALAGRRRQWLPPGGNAGRIAASVLLAIAAASLPSCARIDRGRVYRIGWEPDPPFQVKTAGGEPTGFSIELVRQAAARRGIKLQWVSSSGSEKSLRSGAVDLWPLMTITPERQQVLHLTAPYVQHEHLVLVPVASSYRQPADLGSVTLAYFKMPMNERLAHEAMPNVRLLPAASSKETIEDVCRGAADAAFVEEFSASSTLLAGTSCQNRPLRTIWIPALQTRLGIGATFEAAAVADE